MSNSNDNRQNNKWISWPKERMPTCTQSCIHAYTYTQSYRGEFYPGLQ